MGPRGSAERQGAMLGRAGQRCHAHVLQRPGPYPSYRLGLYRLDVYHSFRLGLYPSFRLGLFPSFRLGLFPSYRLGLYRLDVYHS
ncbi:unnamed protein product [Gadus morhua 'NCC']